MAVFEDLAFDGFVARLARPESPSGASPAVLVMPDAWGRSDFSVGQAGRLADLGYLALAGDLYGGAFYSTDPQVIGTQWGSVLGDDGEIRARVRANMEALAAVDGVDVSRLGAIGYCLGGKAVLELARSGYDCLGVVSFHGLLTTSQPAAPGAVRASVLVCTGADDPYAPLADVTAFQDEMTAAGADCQVTVYTGTQHSFTNPEPAGDVPGLAFHPLNARRSWQATLDFFDERMGVPAAG